MEKIDINEFITAVRSSCSHSIATYTMGNCFGFYRILKVVFLGAEPYETGGHVITKIDDKYYDIRGEVNMDNIKANPIINENLHNHSIWSDERRMKYNEEYRNELLSINNRKIEDVINIDKSGKIIIKEDKYDN